MSYFKSPEFHAANPPSTWQIVKTGKVWHIHTADGFRLSYTHERKRDAVQELTEALAGEGMLAVQYEKEGRWFAGASISGWRDYAEILAHPKIYGTP